ncbi:unnamed protein product, partial [Adineta steineri]
MTAPTSKISAKLASAQSTARRSNVPSLPRVVNNGTEAVTTASAGANPRPPTVGDVLRKLSNTRKLNRSNSEKLSVNSISSSGSV